MIRNWIRLLWHRIRRHKIIYPPQADGRGWCLTCLKGRLRIPDHSGIPPTAIPVWAWDTESQQAYQINVDKALFESYQQAIREWLSSPTRVKPPVPPGLPLHMRVDHFTSDPDEQALLSARE